MTPAEMLSLIEARFDRLDVKVDSLHSDLAQTKVVVEHRLTKVEVKSSVFGTIGGAIGGFLTSWFTGGMR